MRADLIEHVTREPAGPGPDGPEYTEVRTGRLRRPESLGEWTAQQLAHLDQFRAWPAGRVAAELVEAGGEGDVKSAGRDLSEWDRHAVLTALGELVTSARQSYPPAAAVVERLRREWVRKWGSAEPYPPPRPREAVRAARRPVAAMFSDPPSAEQVRARWDGLEAGAMARLAGKPGA